MYTCVWGGAHEHDGGVGLKLSSPIVLPLYVLMWSLSIEPTTLRLDYTSWTVCPRDFPYLLLPPTGITRKLPCPSGIYVGSGHPNSGPYGY